MRTNAWFGLVVLAHLFAWTGSARGESPVVLWSIGQPDNRSAEFAGAPSQYAQFRDDGFFVVGQSDAQRDWPYVHPGPADAWAGSRSHTFTVIFQLEGVPTEGTASLRLDLVDTHGSSPPRLQVEMNGQRFEKALPAGGGDASINGEADRGREHVWELGFPLGRLRTGQNTVTITTLAGSWMLYDSVELRTPPGVRLAPVPPGTQVASVKVAPYWLWRGEAKVQPIQLRVQHVGDRLDAQARLGDGPAVPVEVQPGWHTIELVAPAVERESELTLRIAAGDRALISTTVRLLPPRLRELWVLPHSHVDIGYTHRQAEVVEIQIKNLLKAMELARASAANPPGQRFKWNPEAVWVIDHFLERATPGAREAFVAAVKRGEVGVDGLYANMLTGLCRPEELAQCLRLGTRVASVTGVPVDSAAICDVPGWTWGLVSMMAQAGVKYFAIGPNHSARIGTIHQWDNRPFYWQSPSRKGEVLCYVVDNYHFLGNLEHHVLGHTEKLLRESYPYDSAPLFWVGTWPDGAVDNAPPDERLVEKVTAWNQKYAAPSVILGLASEFFRQFESRHGPRVPRFAGDLTPYWEDGAGSTARETGLNRASADRLSQAETLFACLDPGRRPAAAFEAAWKNVLLYSEHTWGAHNSISEPDAPFVTDQWRVKQAFALDADRQARELLHVALAGRRAESGSSDTFDVFNTTQWPRTDLVLLPPALAGDKAGALDDRGRPLPAQRLSSGDLAIMVREVPGFGARRIRLTGGAGGSGGLARVEGQTLRTANLSVELDLVSGAIRSLRRKGLDHEFVAPETGMGLNDYRYVLGTNTAGALANSPVSWSVLDSGPLVATLRLSAEAPGCRALVREVRVVDGLDRVECINHVDRHAVREKDSVHFAYPFQVEGGTVRMETPWAVVRPNVDQLPGSCRNWFTVQRWVDVSNSRLGVTWAPVDAPLIQVGAMTANLMGPVAWGEWLNEAIDSSTLYSWAQNNHWFTNYKADQPGVTTFRYIIRPHRGGYQGLEAARFGLETTRPLLAVPVDSERPAPRPLLRVASPGVLVETVKVSEDGRALILRLFGVSGADERVKLDWDAVKPGAVWLSDLSERPLLKAPRAIQVPAYEVVTLRAELP
jgi:hypothetical protein